MYRYEYRNKSDTRLKKIIEIRNDLQNEEKKKKQGEELSITTPAQPC